MKMLLAIAVGGAVGSVARHLLAARVMAWLGTGFPWGILTVNVLGGFIMGALVEVMALRWSVSLEWRAFLTVGILGGFTTFSSFSLDTVLLMQRGDYGPAALYVVGSVALSVGALFGAMMLVRAVLA
ncbi:MAG: fluoride efflux transporter CrcB [Rhodospirillales bacterium]|jgi:CrcB protein|nr:fluoride efflux transporter CrcB [Rhodospirillales bacterium]